MKAVLMKNFGDVDVLQLGETEKPNINDQQLLVRVHATAMNRADILQRKGFYPPPKGESELLGLEIAGEVVAVGEKVENFSLGDRVFGLVPGGGYAEYCVLEPALAMPIPDDWDYTYAAAIPEVFLTGHETLFHLGELKANETVLIHAGGSGVGTAGVQMAHLAGAIVYITAGSEQKINGAIELGATAGINYKTEDFVEKMLEFTEQHGVDVIQDFIGADYFAKNLSLLKAGGRLIQVALMSGRKAEIDLAKVLKQRLQIKGSVMRSRSLADKAAMSQRFFARWFDALKTKQLKPVIDSIFPLSMVKDAHLYMEANKNFGKIILEMD